jgi:ankyrin repeat protein
MKDAALTLLEYGADVNAIDSQGITALGEAARLGHLEMTKFLLELGARFEWTDQSSFRPFQLAVINGHEDVAAYLAASGCSTGQSETQVLLALCKAGMAASIKRATESGGDVNATDNEGTSPLMFAASGNWSELAQYLLSAGANIRAQNKSGQTACYIAGENGHFDLALDLLEHYNTSDQRDHLLGLALKKEYQKTSDLHILRLVLAGADVTVKGRDELRTPPLVAACRAGSRRLVRILIEHNTPVDESDRNGTTAVMEASSRLERETVAFLVKESANILAFDDEGNGPVSYALRSSIDDPDRKKEFVLFLMELGADESACDRDLFRAIVDTK